jgi:hypothetical protein
MPFFNFFRRKNCPGRNMIEAVSFGSITISGKTYRSDLVLFPDGRIQTSWWRSAGHRLSLADIEALAAASPEAIVAGCGVYGKMRPDPDLAAALSARGIAFFAAPNDEAAKIYNQNRAKRPTGGCFHLTC